MARLKVSPVRVWSLNKKNPVLHSEYGIPAYKEYLQAAMDGG